MSDHTTNAHSWFTPSKAPVRKPGSTSLLEQLHQRTPHGDADTIVFTNQRGGQLTRYGVRHILRKYVTASLPAADTLRGKRIHPHTLRHTTAIHLLKAGVDFATISQWLGHATLNTTMAYARADLDTKRQALNQVFPDHLAPTEPLPATPARLSDWLKHLRAYVDQSRHQPRPARASEPNST